MNSFYLIFYSVKSCFFSQLNIIYTRNIYFHLNSTKSFIKHQIIKIAFYFAVFSTLHQYIFVYLRKNIINKIISIIINYSNIICRYRIFHIFSNDCSADIRFIVFISLNYFKTHIYKSFLQFFFKCI